MTMKKIPALLTVAFIVSVVNPGYAANPFSDVPRNHWAYTAVEQLAAKGILEGYPNDIFKGNRAMTRYEIAQMVARMMVIGIRGDDAREIEKLIAEFTPELVALGVKVKSFDRRVKTLEKSIGSWNISGKMRFDYNSYKSGFKKYREEFDTKNGFTFDKARLILHKELAQGVSFDSELANGVFDRWWITAEDFLGMGGLTFKSGQFDIDFEGEDRLYYEGHEDHGMFMGLPYRGMQLTKDFGLAEVTGFTASCVGDDGVSLLEADDDGEFYGLRLKLIFGEKVWLSGNYYIIKSGSAPIGPYESWPDFDAKTLWIAAGFKINEGVDLKGAYYKQDLDNNTFVDENGNIIDTPKAWKVVLNVEQEVLKFTSLWAEYASFDAGFFTENVPYAFHVSFSDCYGALRGNEWSMFPVDTKTLFVALKQQWNEKWSSFERYAHYDFDSDFDKVKDWAVGVGYQYTPNLYFELAYNRVDAGDLAPNVFKKGDIIRFRTLLSF